MARPALWKDEYLKIIQKACQLGATDLDLAEMLGVSLRTIRNWMSDKPEVAEATKVGKAEADDKVERSLYQRAMGYSQPATKLFMYQGTVLREDYIEQFPPDTAAMIFWLKNRRPDEWRDKRIEEREGDKTVIVLQGGVEEDAPN